MLHFSIIFSGHRSSKWLISFQTCLFASPQLRQCGHSPIHDLLSPAVLAIVPDTFHFMLLLQPIFVWQAWRCVTNVDFEWTFTIKEPLWKYELIMDQNPPSISKRRLPISSVLLDALDLFCSLREIGWSWSPTSSPQWSAVPPSESIRTVFISLLSNITVFDSAHYLIQLVCPAVSTNPNGGSFFDRNLRVGFFARSALAAFSKRCILSLVGRVVFRQHTSDRPPPPLRRLWYASWWRAPRRPGALMGAFAVSAVVHDYVGVWRPGYGSEFSTVEGFFLLHSHGPWHRHGGCV